jgi:hypothetical protein
LFINSVTTEVFKIPFRKSNYLCTTYYFHEVEYYLVLYMDSVLGQFVFQTHSKLAQYFQTCDSFLSSFSSSRDNPIGIYSASKGMCFFHFRLVLLSAFWMNIFISQIPRLTGTWNNIIICIYYCIYWFYIFCVFFFVSLSENWIESMLMM